MHSSSVRQRPLLRLVLALSLVVQSVSCGSILYPERIGQTRGALDPKVVALDTVGLLLFVVPGAVAFAVDFYNGTIYLPNDTYRAQSPDLIEEREWVQYAIPNEIQSKTQLEQHLTERIEHPVNFDTSAMAIYRLDSPPDQTPVSLKKKEGKGFLKSLNWKRLFSRRAHEKTSATSATEV